MSNILVTRSSMPSFEEYCEEIKEIWDSHWLTNMGVKHKELQKELENYLGIPHVALYTNGHLALENAIAALNLPKGGEVITTPFTFASTTHAIVRNGLIPVFCDIKEDDYTIDTQKLENLITDNTVAIVPVHVYGNICDVEEIDRISKKYGLKVIYDAAHAFAVKYKGESSACFGDASMFSFHATKVFNTIEGGCVCFKDDSWVQLLNDMKNFGIHGPESVQFVGANAKMNEFQATMGICNLKHLNKEIEKRKHVVEHYRSRLEGVERKLEGREYTAWYALADGNASLINFASMYNQPGYPSNCYSVTTTHTNKLDRYLNEVDPNFKKALKESGCKEGIAWIEMMLDKDGHFYVLETGYRMSGDMMARVHKNVSNFDTYAWLVDIASGKKHTALDLPKSQDEEPQRCGCSYILWSEEEGTISRIEGLSEIKNLPGININIDGNLKVGNRVSKHQYLYVITFDTENISKMCNVIEQINNTVKIFDQQNNDIVIRYTDFNSLNAGE